MNRLHTAPKPMMPMMNVFPSLFRLLSAGLLAALFPSSVSSGDFQGATHMTPYDEDTIAYSKTAASGAVAQLQRRLETGESALRFDTRFGYLLSLLEELKVPRSSQMLVFSKTSFQRERISPQTPRALFFNDDVYVGFIPGSPMIEISTADPKLGGVFYTLGQTQDAKPKIVRNDQCLECHASSKSMGVPGHLVRSFVTDESGVVDLQSGTSLVTHRTPLEERWGGWYVTGDSGQQTHRGNLFGKSAWDRHERESGFPATLTNLSRFFRTVSYPEPTSDIVALMVLEHQTHTHNFITRLHYETTLALAQYGHIRYLKSTAEAFLKYLLFTEEAPLTGPIRGSSDFARSFANHGPKDKLGRSLCEFDLRTRLFKYPCSYLIYSEAFDALPDPMKAHLYRRLWEILSGRDTSSDFRRTPAEIKRDILEILAETKPGLPDYWIAADTVGQNAAPSDSSERRSF